MRLTLLFAVLALEAAWLGCVGASAAASAAAPAPAPFADVMRAAERGGVLRILAMGDSMTEGWTPSTNAKVPYTARLQQRLQERLRLRGVRVEVTNAGIGGAGLLDRIGEEWARRTAPGAPRFDVVVSMAGVNDLVRQRRRPADVLRRYEQLWSAAEAAGAAVAVVPLLPVGYAADEPARRELAGLVRGAVAARRAADDRGVALIDAEAAFAPRLRDRAVYDDEIHLTSYGYSELLQSQVFDGLARLLGI